MTKRIVQFRSLCKFPQFVVIVLSLEQFVSRKINNIKLLYGPAPQRQQGTRKVVHPSITHSAACRQRSSWSRRDDSSMVKGKKEELKEGSCGDLEAFTHRPPRWGFSGRRTMWLTCWLWLNSRQRVLEDSAVQARRACAHQPWTA